MNKRISASAPMDQTPCLLQIQYCTQNGALCISTVEGIMEVGTLNSRKALNQPLAPGGGRSWPLGHPRQARIGLRAMAPSRRKASRIGAGKGALRSQLRGEALLRDFDREVKKRLEEVRVSGENLQKEVSNLYDVALLRLPVAVREMNWLSYLALGGSEKALEKVALGGLDIAEITQLASAAIQTPIKTVKKAKKLKQPVETIEEEPEGPILPAGKRSRQGKEAATTAASEPDPEASHQKLGKVKRSSRPPPSSKRTRPPSARPSKAAFLTPAGQGGQGPATTRGTTPLLTPKFDSSIFKTPGLRAPVAHERVFSISANGSPLAESREIFITLPVGGGESLRVRASQLKREDLLRLNPDTLGSVEKLSSELLHLCNSVRGQGGRAGPSLLELLP
uniref:Borealin n=1 Tax=Pogona vitticeps TaxID=103695 RepID=A0ABM5FVK4_9SAUR